MALDGAGDVYVLTQASAALVLTKYDPFGAVVWSKSFPTNGDNAVVAAYPSGEVVLAGSSPLLGGAWTNLRLVTSVDFGAGSIGPGAFLVAFDAAGNLLFQKTVPTDPVSHAIASPHAVVVLPNGDIVEAGNMWGAVDFGAGPVGTTGESPFLARYDACGRLIASRQFAVDGGDWSWLGGLAALPNDDVVVAGLFQGSIDLGAGAIRSPTVGYDIFVAKFDSTGAYVTGRNLGLSDPYATLDAPAVDAEGDVVIAGAHRLAMQFGTTTLPATTGDLDIYVAKLGPDLRPIWATRFGDTSFQSASAVALDPSNDILLTGLNSGTVDFGNGVTLQPTSTQGDPFLVKLDPTGHGLAVDWESGSIGSTAVVLAPDASHALWGVASVGSDFGIEPAGLTGHGAGFVARFVP